MPFKRLSAKGADPFLRTTVDAVVFHCERDFVDLRWPRPGLPHAIGRLYQRESMANASDAPLLTTLPRYALGETLRVYVYKSPGGKDRLPFYYVNERWADDRDPWAELNLYEGDVVSGTIMRAVSDVGQLKAWLVQLDAGQPFPDQPDAGVQPDIEVFLPLTELPWADGSIGELPGPGGKNERLELLRGDRVLLRVFELPPPPLVPSVSISRHINHLDTIEVSTRWGQVQNSYQADAGIIATDIGLLAQQVIWLVDDSEQQMLLLQHRLEANGAKTKAFLVKEGNWQQRCIQIVHDLADSALTAPISGNRAPDLVLVDLHLLGQLDGGVQLVKAWLELEIKAKRTIPRCALLSNFINLTTPLPECCATLHRPLQMSLLLRVLSGESIWQTGTFSDLEIGRTKVMTPDDLLLQLRADLKAEFVVLLAARGPKELCLLSNIGHAPFTEKGLNSAYEHSPLRLLQSGQLPELVIESHTSNTVLKTASVGSAAWMGLRDGFSTGTGVEWILGVGTKDVLPANERRWLARYVAQALVQMRQATGMNDVADLLGKGMRLDSLAHEWLRRQNFFNDAAQELRQLAIDLADGKSDANYARAVLEQNLPEWEVATAELQQTADFLLGVQRGRHTPLDLTKLLKVLRPVAEESCDDRKVSLIWPKDVYPLVLDLPATVVSVPLLNLIDNAAKHHVRKENNYVKFGLALPHTGPYAHHLVLSVQDNSFGLNADQRANLFKPMQSTAAVGERHGIGLWLSQQVVEHVGGRLELAWSWRGVGSQFNVVLPMPLTGNLGE